MAATDLLAWFQRFWGRTEGDSESAVRDCERRLGVKLPRLLREVYRHVSLRAGAQIELLELEAIEIVDGVLVFARPDNQLPSQEGIPVDCLQEENPPLVVSTHSLQGFLTLFCVANRAHEPPCVNGPLTVGAGLLQLGWDEYGFEDGYRVWVKGSVAADSFSVGALTRSELERVLGELGLPAHAVDD